MPFRSKAQQRFMFAAEARGELPKGTARRWAHETPDMKDLPERMHKKASRRIAELNMVLMDAGENVLVNGAHGIKIANEERAKRLAGAVDDVGIGVLAAPYAAKGLSKLKNRPGVLGAVGRGADVAAHAMHKREVPLELAGLGLVSHTGSKTVGKLVDRALPQEKVAALDALIGSFDKEFEYLPEKEKQAARVAFVKVANPAAASVMARMFGNVGRQAMAHAARAPSNVLHSSVRPVAAAGNTLRGVGPAATGRTLRGTGPGPTLRPTGGTLTPATTPAPMGPQYAPTVRAAGPQPTLRPTGNTVPSPAMTLRPTGNTVPPTIRPSGESLPPSASRTVRPSGNTLPPAPAPVAPWHEKGPFHSQSSPVAAPAAPAAAPVAASVAPASIPVAPAAAAPATASAPTATPAAAAQDAGTVARKRDVQAKIRKARAERRAAKETPADAKKEGKPGSALGLAAKGLLVGAAGLPLYAGYKGVDAVTGLVNDHGEPYSAPTPYGLNRAF